MSRWISLLTSRTVMAGIAAVVAAVLKEVYNVELSTESFIGILVGFGTIVAYLLNKDWVQLKQAAIDKVPEPSKPMLTDSSKK